MLSSLNEYESGHIFSTSVVIVGSGPAGCVIADQLSSQGISCLILESGNFLDGGSSQSLNNGFIAASSLNHMRPEELRERRVGGCTNSWGGACLPLDPVDFLEGYSRKLWPFEYSFLKNFYKRADTYFGIKSEFFSPNKFNCFNKRLEDETFQIQIFQASKKFSNFQRLLNVNTLTSKNLSLLVDATVTDVILEDDFSTVSYLELKSYDQKIFRVVADYYVLAAGGLENPRILLNSSKQLVHGVSNNSGLVGNYYSPHINISHGVLTLFDGVKAHTTWSEFADDILIRPYLKLSDHKILTNGLVNCQVTLKSLGAPSINKMLRNDLLHSVYEDIEKKYLQDSFQSATLDRQYLCYWAFDQTPNDSSAIALSDNKDKFGNRKLVINHHAIDEEFIKIAKVFDLFSEWVTKNGLGLFTYSRDHNLYPKLVNGQSHSMGTTRMSKDAKNGVVNEYGKSHDINNLFIAGSSNFPTYGQANPTYTIVALAIATADEIAKSYSN